MLWVLGTSERRLLTLTLPWNVCLTPPLLGKLLSSLTRYVLFHHRAVVLESLMCFFQADVFLEQRSYQDLERNAMVAVLCVPFCSLDHFLFEVAYFSAAFAI